jgi:hypothetical protein
MSLEQWVVVVDQLQNITGIECGHTFETIGHKISGNYFEVVLIALSIIATVIVVGAVHSCVYKLHSVSLKSFHRFI